MLVPILFNIVTDFKTSIYLLIVLIRHLACVLLAMLLGTYLNYREEGASGSEDEQEVLPTKSQLQIYKSYKSYDCKSLKS